MYIPYSLTNRHLQSVLSVLQIASLPGLNFEQIALLPTDSTTDWDEDLLTLISAISQSDRMLMLGYHASQRDLLATFSRGKSANLAHIRPEPNYHQFAHVDAPHTINEWLLDTIWPNDLPDNFPSSSIAFSLAEESLSKAQTAAMKGDFELTRQGLIAAGIDREFARGLAVTLATVIAQSALIVVDHPQDSQHREVLAEIVFWEGTNGLWMFERAISSASTTVSRINHTQLQETLLGAVSLFTATEIDIQV